MKGEELRYSLTLGAGPFSGRPGPGGRDGMGFAWTACKRA